MGLALVIVFGGHQLISNLPATHSASSFCFRRAEKKSCAHHCLDVFHFAQTSVAVLALAALMFL